MKKSIKINFFLFFALFWVSLLAIINPVIAQTPLVTVERLLIPAGRGPFAEYASGQARTYLNNDTKAFKINIDGQTLSAPLIDGRLQLTVPKMMWFDVETGPNFIFSGENIVIRDWDRIIIDRTTDPNNYILSFPLKTIDPTTKGIVSFDFWTHDKQTVPTLFVFNTTVSIMDKDKNVLSTATMADPFILGNTATKFFVARARFISINNLVTDRRAIYAGAQLTEPNPPSRNYIDPNRTEPVAYYALPEYANGDTYGKFTRALAEGTLRVPAPTYSCLTGICTALFDATHSVGWAADPNDPSVYIRTMSGYQGNPAYMSPETAWSAYRDFHAANPIYFTYPNAIVNSSTTTTMSLVDSKPINFDDTTEDPITYSDSLISTINSTIAFQFAKSAVTSKTNFDEGEMHHWSLPYTTTVFNQNSAPIQINDFKDHDFDSRIFLEELAIPLELNAHVKEIWATPQGGGAEIALKGDLTLRETETHAIYTVEAATKAAVDAQVLAVEQNGADPSSLEPITRMYQAYRIEFEADNNTIGPGTDYSIIWGFKLTNPYQLAYTVYPDPQPSKFCVKGAGTPANKNYFCNFASISANLVALNSNLPIESVTTTLERSDSTQIEKINPRIVSHDPVRANNDMLQVYYNLGARVLSSWNFSFSDVPAKYRFDNMKVVALLPPGVDYDDPEADDPKALSGFYASNEKMRQFTRSKTVVPNYKNTGLTAVILEFDPFTRKDITDLQRFNLSFGIPFKLGRYSIYSEKMDAYQDEYSDRAGMIPDNIPNKIFLALSYDGIDNWQGGPGDGTIPNTTAPYNATVTSSTTEVTTTTQGRYLFYDRLDFDDDEIIDEPMLILSLKFLALFDAFSDAEKLTYTEGNEPTQKLNELKANEPFFYRFQANNNSPRTLDSLVLYDVLPFVGDTNYPHPGGEPYPNRDSAFRPVMTGPVIPSVTDLFDISYCTAASPNWNPVEGAADDGCDWQATPADWSAVIAIRITLAEDKEIGMFSFPYFEVPMSMPPAGAAHAESYLTAKNGFMLSYDAGTTFAKSNDVQVGRLVSFPVTKIWNGGKDYPEVTVHVYADGAEEPVPDQTVTLNAENNWTGVFENLKGYTDEDPPNPITYTVKEMHPADGEADPLENYTTSITGSVTAGNIQGFEITNTYVIPTGEINAEKIWVEGELTVRPTVYFRLFRQIGANGTPEPVPAEQAAIMPLPAGTTTVTWETVALTNEDGEPYIFTVRETDETGEDAIPENYSKAESGLTVTNTYIKEDPDLPGTGFPIKKQ